MAGVFDETKHARGTGARGGQFVAKGASKSGQTLGYDAKKGTGAGYGTGGKGDGNVKSLQTYLNNLGFTDQAGKPLKVDGKLGPKTTAAVKKLQRKLGLKADGLVTPSLLHKLREASIKKGPGKPAKKTVPQGQKKAKPAAGKSKAKPPAKKATGQTNAQKSRETANYRKGI